MKKISVKTFISITVFIFTVCVSNAQLPVTDAAALASNKANWARSLAESVKTTKELQETRKMMTESIEIYTKVSNTIRNAKLVENIIQRQVDLAKAVSLEFARKDIQSPKIYASYCSMLKGVIDENIAYIEMMKVAISSSEKMTPGERMNLILEIDKQTKNVITKFQYKKRKFEDYNDRIQMHKKLSKIRF